MTTPKVDPSLSEIAAAEQAVQRVRTTVAVAHGLAVAGRRVDLAGLDAATGMLCAQVLDLPPGSGLRLRPELAELEHRLAQLERALKGAAT